MGDSITTLGEPLYQPMTTETAGVCLLAWREVLDVGGVDQPRGRSLGRIARRIGPVECGAAPRLDVDPQVLLLPGSQRDRIHRAKKIPPMPVTLFI